MYVLVNDLLAYCVRTRAFIFVVSKIKISMCYPCVHEVSLDIRNGGLEFEETEF